MSTIQYMLGTLILMITTHFSYLGVKHLKNHTVLRIEVYILIQLVILSIGIIQISTSHSSNIDTIKVSKELESADNKLNSNLEILKYDAAQLSNRMLTYLTTSIDQLSLVSDPSQRQAQVKTIIASYNKFFGNDVQLILHKLKDNNMVGISKVPSNISSLVDIMDISLLLQQLSGNKLSASAEHDLERIRLRLSSLSIEGDNKKLTNYSDKSLVLPNNIIQPSDTATNNQLTIQTINDGGDSYHLLTNNVFIKEGSRGYLIGLPHHMPPDYFVGMIDDINAIYLISQHGRLVKINKLQLHPIISQPEINEIHVGSEANNIDKISLSGSFLTVNSNNGVFVVDASKMKISEP